MESVEDRQWRKENLLARRRRTGLLAEIEALGGDPQVLRWLPMREVRDLTERYGTRVGNDRRNVFVFTAKPPLGAKVAKRKIARSAQWPITINGRPSDRLFVIFGQAEDVGFAQCTVADTRANIHFFALTSEGAGIASVDFSSWLIVDNESPHELTLTYWGPQFS